MTVGVVFDVVNDIDDVPEPLLSCTGLKDAVVPAGKPEATNWTGDAKPLLAASVTVNRAVCPCATLWLDGEAAIVKSAFDAPVKMKPLVAVTAATVTTTSPPIGVRAQAPRPFDRLTIGSQS